MNEPQGPQNRISEKRGCEAVPFQRTVNSTRHILPGYTSYPGDTSPGVKPADYRFVPTCGGRTARFQCDQAPGGASRITERRRASVPDVTVAVP